MRWRPIRPLDSSTARSAAQTRPDGAGAAIEPTKVGAVTVQLLYEDHAWRVAVKCDRRSITLDGIAELIAYLEQLVLETPAAARRGLR